jgi:ketosteroid isomerase-like protein
MESGIQSQALNMPDEIAAILELEARRARALVDGDVATLDEITAEDYTHVETGGGVRDKAGFLAILSRPGVRFTSWVIEENTVRVYGDTAVVTGRYHNTMRTPAGDQPPKHARHIRVYVRQNGRWRNVAHQATSLAPG